jgi:hypothetical protein
MHGAILLPFPPTHSTSRLGSYHAERHVYIFDFGIQFDFITAIFFTANDILRNAGHFCSSRT